jgi:hypothetical protein
MIPEFFSSKEAITNYTPQASDWVATLIHTGRNLEDAWDKRCQAIEEIRKHCSLPEYVDPLPSVPSTRLK